MMCFVNGGFVRKPNTSGKRGVKKVNCSKLASALEVMDDTKVDKTSVFVFSVSMMVMQCALMKWY